ncbi:MAG: tyrosine-protein phosphatase [Erysipelotrichaceae bacterium]|nr:tyrosine-protein phosphatase [Erysipelotrichaceae bacterium]
MSSISKDLQFKSVKNIRDLGGIVNKDGRMIKEGLLFRSARLSSLSKKEAGILYEDKGIKAVFDFRSPFEAYQSPDVVFDGVDYYQNEIASDEAFGVRRDDETMEELNKIRELLESGKADRNIYKDFMVHFYRSFAISEFSIMQYGKFLRYVLQNDDPILWHCSMGKDRCGIGTALVLELLGVNREDIVEDYLYTNEIYGITDPDEESPFEIADREYIDAFYFEVEKAFGNIENFFKEMNITPEMIASFRDKVLQ